MFAITNKAEDLKPWAIIIARAACNPQLEFIKAPATIKPMWPTEEYAINDLRSDCRKQIILVETAPTNATLARALDVDLAA